VGAIANTYANSYANSVGVRANTYADGVGTRANTYADGVATRSNTYADGVGTRANTYADSVGVRANNYSDAVGVRANTYADTVGVRSNNYSSNASTLSSGTVPSARIGPGSYTGITGVGTITVGIWNGTDIAVADGGTGASNATDARTNLGLGTMSTQGSSAVTITGGSISGLSSLGVSGDITATGDVTAFSSDARLKGDIQIITDALSKVKLITGVTYIHNDLAKSFGYTDESRFAGVLAQEVEAVLPEVVVPAPFDIADDGTSKSGENYKTVKYEKIVPLLIEAIKELTEKVEMLESRVNE
jgi:hypothetical protein